MIGRSLRAAVNLTALGPRTCIVDCDVLQADGGTRTAAVTGGYAALEIALKKHIADGSLPRNVLRFPVAAVSVGMAAGQPMVDLTYEEDFHADVDLNIVMDEKGRYIEIQGTAEGAPFYPRDLDAMVKLASNSIADLFKIQRSALEGEA
jgi:ribonuclease PH